MGERNEEQCAISYFNVSQNSTKYTYTKYFRQQNYSRVIPETKEAGSKVVLGSLKRNVLFRVAN